MFVSRTLLSEFGLDNSQVKNIHSSLRILEPNDASGHSHCRIFSSNSKNFAWLGLKDAFASRSTYSGLTFAKHFVSSKNGGSPLHCYRWILPFRLEPEFSRSIARAGANCAGPELGSSRPSHGALRPKPANDAGRDETKSPNRGTCSRQPPSRQGLRTGPG